MSDALTDLQAALKAFKDKIQTDSLAVAAKVQEAKATLDSVSGEQSKLAAMAALAAGIDTLQKGEAVVAATSTAKWKEYFWIAGGVAVVVVVGVAAVYWKHITG
jgi:hypothetical protein